eukprot:g1841.t1
MIHNLHQLRYIDLQTRVVTFELTVYNAALNQWIAVRIAAEMVPGGGVVPSAEFISGNLYRFSFDWATGVTADFYLEVVIACFYLYFWIDDIVGCCRLGRKKCCAQALEFTVVIHRANLVCWCLGVFLRILVVLHLPQGPVDVNTDEYVNFHVAALLSFYENGVGAMNAWLIWFKVVNYLSFSSRFGLLTSTLARSLKLSMSFLLIFVIILWGFVQAHLMCFGTHLKNYRNVQQTVYSLITSLMGDFDFESMNEVQPTLGPAMFLIFVVCCVFMVFNILIAIISDAYAHAKDTLERDPAPKSPAKLN